jgi:hypothetical protein
MFDVNAYAYFLMPEKLGMNVMVPHRDYPNIHHLRFPSAVITR